MEKSTITEIEMEKIIATMFYQQAWGRYFFLKGEIEKLDASIKAHLENNKNDDDKYRIFDRASEILFFTIMMEKYRKELKQLTIRLNAKKWLESTQSP